MNSKEEMSDHIKKVHNDIAHICNICGKGFKSSMALQRHIKIHEGFRGSACEVSNNTLLTYKKIMFFIE